MSDGNQKAFFINNNGTVSIDGENIDSKTIPELLSAWKVLVDTTDTKIYIHSIGTALLQELAARRIEQDSSLKDLTSINHKLDMKRIYNQVIIQNQNDVLAKLRHQCTTIITETSILNKMIESLKKDKGYLQDLIKYQKEQIK